MAFKENLQVDIHDAKLLLKILNKSPPPPNELAAQFFLYNPNLASHKNNIIFINDINVIIDKCEKIMGEIICFLKRRGLQEREKFGHLSCVFIFVLLCCSIKGIFTYLFL